MKQHSPILQKSISLSLFIPSTKQQALTNKLTVTYTYTYIYTRRISAFQIAIFSINRPIDPCCTKRKERKKRKRKKRGKNVEDFKEGGHRISPLDETVETWYLVGKEGVAGASVELNTLGGGEGKNKGKDKGGREEARQNFEWIEPTDYSCGNS